MTYDYIIIGAGSAGCVMANRLSASGQYTVLLLEAGQKDKHINIHIPGAYSKLHRSSYDWGFSTIPQKNVLDRKIYLPRGKVLGGSSSTNAMAYVRGNAQDYDDWAATGCVGWTAAEVLPYFIKSESNQQACDLDAGYHGTDGPLNVSYAAYFESPLAKSFIDACQSVGLPPTRDYNGHKQNSTSKFQFTIKNGQRHSAASAFLKPVMERKNLTVITSAQVAEILLSKNCANGARLTNGSIFKASIEVILCAGSFQSPQLLMLSGIGDREKLSKHSIECKHHLPGVGQNLQDHLFYFISCHTKSLIGFNHYARPWDSIREITRYVFTKKNNALTCSPLEAVAFFNTENYEDRVNCQFHFAPFHINDGQNVDLYDFKTIPTDKDGYTILPSLLRPKSHGQVNLADKNPATAPIIDPNFLSHEDDLSLLVKGGRLALEVTQQDTLASKATGLLGLQYGISDDALAQFIKSNLETIYHPVGTCKMGIDDMSVVDPTLSVYGIEGLRVVDGSIMPTIISGNTNAPIYMIAEKGADIVLESQK